MTYYITYSSSFPTIGRKRNSMVHVIMLLCLTNHFTVNVHTMIMTNVQLCIQRCMASIWRMFSLFFFIKGNLCFLATIKNTAALFKLVASFLVRYNEMQYVMNILRGNTLRLQRLLRPTLIWSPVQNNNSNNKY